LLACAIKGIFMAIQLTYLEKDIEDLLEKNCPYYLGLKFITRQFHTPNGIVDVIAKHPENHDIYYVIEIKKDTLDSQALTQVLRYSKWLNSEYSKEGKRLFLPLLIGNSISQEIYQICEYFEPDEHCSLDSYHKILYRAFDFNPYRGVSFEYFGSLQKKYNKSLEIKHNHIQSTIDRYEIMEWKLACRITDLQNELTSYQPALSLVKNA
jgi:Endonuclease NucS